MEFTEWHVQSRGARVEAYYGAGGIASQGAQVGTALCHENVGPWTGTEHHERKRNSSHTIVDTLKRMCIVGATTVQNTTTA